MDASKPYDTYFKALFRTEEVVESFLLSFADKELSKIIDLKTLEQLPNELQDKYAMRQGDVIWKANFANGNDCYLIFLFEFQRSQDKWMIVRMGNYIYSLYKMLIDSNKIKGNLLPPVFPIVIYNGARPWNYPNSMDEIIQKNLGYLQEYQPKAKYHLLDLKHIENVTPNSLANIIALIEQASDNKELREKVKILHEKLTERGLEALIPIFCRYIIMLMRINAKDLANSTDIPNTFEEVYSQMEYYETYVDRAYAKGIIQGRNEGLTQGRNEGLTQGRNEGLTQGRNEGLIQGRNEGRNEGLIQGRNEGLTQGRNEGLTQSTEMCLRNLMNYQKCDARTGMIMLGIPADKWQFYDDLLAKHAMSTNGNAE